LKEKKGKGGKRNLEESYDADAEPKKDTD